MLKMVRSLLEKVFSKGPISNDEIEKVKRFLRKDKRRAFFYKTLYIGLMSLCVVSLIPGHRWSFPWDNISNFYGTLAATLLLLVVLTRDLVLAFRVSAAIEADLRGLEHADLASAMKEHGIKDLSADAIAYVDKVSKLDRPLVAFELKRILQSEGDEGDEYEW